MEKRTIFTWNAIFIGFVQGGRAKEAFDFFHEMLSLSKGGVWPDKIMILRVLLPCTHLGAIEQGTRVHDLVCDVVIGTALVDMYGKCGYVREAYDIFREMPKRVTLLWTADFVLGAFEQGTWVHNYLRVHDLECDVVIGTELVDMYGECGYVREAYDIFREMPKRDTLVWTAMISSFAGNDMDTLKLLVLLMRWKLLGRAELFEEAERLIESMPMKPYLFVWGIKGSRFNDAMRIRDMMKERGLKKEVSGCNMIEIEGVVHEFSVREYSTIVSTEIKLLLGSIKLIVWSCHLYTANPVNVECFTINNFSNNIKMTSVSQVELALERGFPAMIGNFISKQLPYPSWSFVRAHCTLCGIDKGKKEVGRVIKPEGYCVLTSPGKTQKSSVNAKRRMLTLQVDQFTEKKIAAANCNASRVKSAEQTKLFFVVDSRKRFVPLLPDEQCSNTCDIDLD
ncbi:hypothetical protein ACFE04_013675 [Oxalis oulophora]